VFRWSVFWVFLVALLITTWLWVAALTDGIVALQLRPAVLLEGTSLTALLGSMCAFAFAIRARRELRVVK
jgi:hypothetical protein